jgi:glycine hydroxymethyltransferase
MKKIASFIDRAIKNVENESELKNIKNEVADLCSQFPLYPELKLN